MPNLRRIDDDGDETAITVYTVVRDRIWEMDELIAFGYAWPCFLQEVLFLFQGHAGQTR